MTRKWYVYKDDSQRGPYPLEELQQQIQKGDLLPQDWVRAEGMADWTPALEAQELFPRQNQATATAEPAQEQPLPASEAPSLQGEFHTGPNGQQHYTPTLAGWLSFADRIRTFFAYIGLVELDKSAYIDEIFERDYQSLNHFYPRGHHERLIHLDHLERNEEHLERAVFSEILLPLFLVVVLAAAIFFTTGRDLTARWLGGDDQVPPVASSDELVHPERPARAEDILPPELIPAICDGLDDCANVVQVPLDLNPAAKYQFGYDAGGSRMAIFSGLEGSEYERIVEQIEASHERALNEGKDTAAPKYLDDIGEGAVIYGTMAVFKNNDTTGVIAANTVLGVDSKPLTVISTEDLEELARFTAPRMLSD